MTQYLEADRGCLLITREGGELMMFHGDEDLNLRFPFSRSVVSETLNSKTGLVSFQNPETLDDGPVSSMAVHGVRAAVCAPVLGPNSEDFGIIYFDTRIEARLFTQEQLAEVIEVGRALGCVIAETY